MTIRERLVAYACKYEGDWSKIAKAIKQNEIIKPILIEVQFVTLFDEDYPIKLKSLRYPPWVLFYEGNFELLNKPSIGIVGSRKTNEYGIRCTEKICAVIKSKRVVVSGMARGIDTYAHTYSLNGETIAVLGSGINVIYPKENTMLYHKLKKNHCIVSEYPPNVTAKKHHFPFRNRIIAALSDKLAIPQARIKSGTAITVSYALELGKEVYVIPHQIEDESGDGCNELIYNGAHILLYYEDLL